MSSNLPNAKAYINSLNANGASLVVAGWMLHSEGFIQGSCEWQARNVKGRLHLAFQMKTYTRLPGVLVD